MLRDRFLNLPIKAKFIAVTTFIGGAATALSTLFFVAYYHSANEARLTEELRTIARVIASNTTAAIVFDDPNAARELLSSIRAKPDIVAARIVDGSGKVFTSVGDEAQNERLTASALGAPGEVTSLDETILVDLPVILKDEPIGRIQMVASKAALVRTQNLSLAIAGAILLMALLVSFVLSSSLQRAFLRPILHLSTVMKRVQNDRSYDVRADILPNDELGSLAQGFNEMLETIEDQYKQLEDYQSHLEQQVDERTSQLQDAVSELRHTNTRLNAARLEAEHASRAKSEFLANMSHELRTPLNGIIGFSEMIRNEVLGPIAHPKYREYISDIHTAAQHLILVIGNILDMSKIESGKHELQERPVHVATLVDEAIKLAQLDAQKRNITIRRDLEVPGDMAVNVDETKMRQLLVNIISNAIKYSYDNAFIDIAVRRTDTIEFEITDHGVGIPEDQLPHLFERFVQIENVYARRYQGSGLGLALSKALVELHDGDIELTSKPGEGTRVRISLPLAREIFAQPLRA